MVILDVVEEVLSPDVTRRLYRALHHRAHLRLRFRDGGTRILLVNYASVLSDLPSALGGEAGSRLDADHLILSTNHSAKARHGGR